MCSETDKAVEQSDLALQQAQTTTANTLNQDYATTFSEQQGVLGNLQAKMNYVAANPMGYTPAQLATAKTSINENTATAAKQALGAAAAYAAAHGGADVGSGVAGEIAGQVASNAAQSKAQQLSALSTANETLKQQNFWKAISGLQGVGSEYGGAGGTAIGGAGTAANSATGAGAGAVSANEAELAGVGSILGGIGGLVSAGTGFVGANPGGIFGA